MGTGSSVKDSFGSGLGLAHEFGLAMRDQGVTPANFKQAVSDPIRKATVGAALRGETCGVEVSLETLVAREAEYVNRLCKLMAAAPLGEDLIGSELETAQTRFGGLTANDRFVPKGITIPIMFSVFYAGNSYADQSVKLSHEQNKEWWRTDKSVEHLPTDQGVTRLDFSEVMQATDLVGRPFNLNMAEQVDWANGQGGSVIASAEEVLYLFWRSVAERNRPLWGGASMRCRNACGTGNSLYVYWNAFNGLGVDCFDRAYRYWNLGALPRK